jgi:N-acetylmuramoyl-L-alanine amidase
MIRRLTVCAVLILSAGLAATQEYQGSGELVEFRFGNRSVAVPRLGARVEIMPILAMIGAEAAFSPAADTYGVSYQDHVVQFAIGRKYVLVDGTLKEGPDAPAASPAGVAASIRFLDETLLGPMGYHLAPISNGYDILPGARYADPVVLKPAVADFGSTSTLVLALDRPVEVEVESDPEKLLVHFPKASPQIDRSLPFRSTRVVALESRAQDLVVQLKPGIGLINWHTLSGPDRVILELGAVRPKPQSAPVEIPQRSGPRPIVIDPGHGGSDIGASSNGGVVEKTLVLQIARRLASVLSGKGYPVRVTRDGDENRALTDRTALANRMDATVFISLHANESTAASVRGAETYYMSLDDIASDEQAAATARLENRSQPNDRRAGIDLILWDLAQAEVLNESAKLALAVQDRLNQTLGLKDRGVKQAPFVVLTGASMPAILVEVGFLSNPTEASTLQSADHQQQLAEAIGAGIDDFVRSQ